MTVVTALARLLSGFGSNGAGARLAVLVMVVPGATSLLTIAVHTTVAEPPGSSDGIVAERLAPVPPQGPAFVAQDTNVVSGGSGWLMVRLPVVTLARVV